MQTNKLFCLGSGDSHRGALFTGVKRGRKVNVMFRIGSGSSIRRRRVLLLAVTIVQFVGALSIAERHAYAYIDPGPGLFALQMLGASIVGGIYFLRHKLRSLVAGQPGKGPGAQAMAAARKRNQCWLFISLASTVNTKSRVNSRL